VNNKRVETKNLPVQNTGAVVEPLAGKGRGQEWGTERCFAAAPPGVSSA